MLDRRANRLKSDFYNMIDKREFYLNEVDAIKKNLAAFQKKETIQIEKIDALMRIRKSVNAAVTQYFRNVGFALDMELPSVLLKLHSMNYKDLRRAFDAVKIEYEYHVKREAARQEQMEHEVRQCECSI